MKKLILVPLILLTGCASQGGWSPTVDDRYNEGYVNPSYNYHEQQEYDHNHYQRNDNGYGRRQQYSNRRNLERDMYECRQLALRASKTGKNTLMEGGVGAAIGAGAGAIIGGITGGNVGAAAGYGAAAGALGGAVKGGLSSEEKYKRVYKRCLARRGHNVLD